MISLDRLLLVNKKNTLKIMLEHFLSTTKTKIVKMIKMNSYLLDDDVNYKIIILYILKGLNTDIKRIIYDILVTYEVIEVKTQGWTELDIQDNFYDEFYFDINDLYDDPEIFRDQ